MYAEISDCGTYRYVLKRRIPSLVRWHHPALFIMLNPSTADAEKNDPTIRRCLSFASLNGCTELTVVNLFALRATNPLELMDHGDPVGPFNDQRIAEMIEDHQMGIIVAAWGAHPFAKKRAQYIKERFGPFVCLGTTKDGSPRHPLYIKKDQKLLELK